MRIHRLCLPLLLISAPLWGADGATSRTLTFDALFQAPVTPTQKAAAATVTVGKGPVLIPPQPDVWRVPTPVPSPTPTPDEPRLRDLPLPRFPMLIEKSEPTRRDELPAFASRGRLIGEPVEGHSVVETSQEGRELIISYALQRCDERGTPTAETPLRWHHSPGSSDRFQVPSGMYSMTITFWRPSRPEQTTRIAYPSQRFGAAELYVFTIDDSREKEFAALLDRQ